MTGTAALAQDTVTTTQPRNTLIGVQYLRGLAAMLVVFIHLQEQLQRAGFPISIVDYGSAGVDIFFVISGFVMWHTTVQPMAASEFYRRRVIRIVPLYWLLTTLMLGILLVAPALVRSGAVDWGHVAASFFFIAQPHPSIPNSMFPLLVPGWTLNYEMYFYLLFGAMLFLPAQSRAIAVALVFGGLSLLNLLAPQGLSVFGFYTDPIILEFAVGALLGYACQRGAWLPARIAVPLAIAGITLIVLKFDAPRILSNGIGSMLLVIAIVLVEVRRPIAKRPLPLLIGDASYSIYLRPA